MVYSQAVLLAVAKDDAMALKLVGMMGGAMAATSVVPWVALKVGSRAFGLVDKLAGLSGAV